MAEQCLQVYEGQTLIYVGELDVGDVDVGESIADREAPGRLAHPFEGWTRAESLELPRWESVNDQLFVLRRATGEPKPGFGTKG